MLLALGITMLDVIRQIVNEVTRATYICFDYGNFALVPYWKNPSPVFLPSSLATTIRRRSGQARSRDNCGELRFYGPSVSATSSSEEAI